MRESAEASYGGGVYLLDEREPADGNQGWATRRPYPALRALVSRYIGYRQRGVTLPVHRGLPSGHVTLIVSLTEPIRILGMPGSPQDPLCTGAFAGGLHTGPATGRSSAAQTCGYFDQAHLPNEFNALAGCTPGTWIAEELPFRQPLRASAPGR